MKTIALTLATAATLAALAGPALAQATGSVDVNGTVASRCSAAAPISGTFTLGELTKSDGKVDAAFAGNTGGLSRTFTVVCNGANPRLSVNAQPLVNTAAADPGAGYTNTIHYTATLTAQHAKAGVTTVSDASLSSGATTGALSDRLSAVQNNISLTIGSGVTADTNAVVAAGAYAGKVELVVSPAA